MEIMIGMTICSVAIGWLVSSSSQSLKNQLNAAREIDSHRASDVRFFEAIASLQNFATPSILDSTIKIKSTEIKTTADGKQYRRITFTTPEKAKYGLIIHRNDPGRQKISNQ